MPPSIDDATSTPLKTIRGSIRSRVMTTLQVQDGGGAAASTNDEQVEMRKLLPLQHTQLDASVDAGANQLEDGIVDKIPTLAEGHHQHQSSTSSKGDAWRLIVGATGVYLAYLSYGHIQEDVFSFRAADGSKFQFAWFLQVLESVANIGVGLTGRYFLGGTKGLPLFPFATSGASQVFSKAFTSLALAAGLSFPICILAKSAKIVPVMLGQVLLGSSSYSIRDYGIAAAIVFGTALLTLGESKKKKDQHASTMTGIAFILLSLVMDGFTAGLQKRLKQKAVLMNKTPTPCDFLLYTNVSMVVTALTIALATGDWFQGYKFTTENPAILRMVCQVCVCSAIGQSFIFYIVAHFDPLVCSTVTTTRKIMSVVWSITTKGHALSDQGFMGLLVAVSALMLEVQGKVSRHQREHRKYNTKTSM